MPRNLLFTKARSGGAGLPRHTMLWAVGVVLAIATPTVAGSKDFMVKVFVGNQLLEGRPLSWSKRRMFLLARDGQLVNFRPQEAQDCPAIFAPVLQLHDRRGPEPALS